MNNKISVLISRYADLVAEKCITLGLGSNTNQAAQQQVAGHGRSSYQRLLESFNADILEAEADIDTAITEAIETAKKEAAEEATKASGGDNQSPSTDSKPSNE